jgi:ABC-2 type transport system ATP-binding protein
MFGWLYGRKVDGRKLLEQVQLTEKSKNQVKELSGGQKQRFSIATALVNDPKVIFLDEPTTGLDPQARRNLWELISQINKQGKTVVLTTHYMDEAEVLCDRIAIMDHAKIIALDTTASLLKQTGIDSSIHFDAEGGSCNEGHLKNLPSVTAIEINPPGFRIVTSDPESTLPALFKHAHECGFRILDLNLKQPTLEDVFLKMTGHALRE